MAAGLRGGVRNKTPLGKSGLLAGWMSVLDTGEFGDRPASEFLEELTTILRHTITIAVGLFRQFLNVLGLIINVYNRVQALSFALLSMVFYRNPVSTLEVFRYSKHFCKNAFELRWATLSQPKFFDIQN